SMPAIRKMEDEVRELSVRLIEGFKPNGGCEFVGEFAQHLPIGIFMSMVNLPESDRLPLLHLVDQVINPGERSKQEIFAELFRYVAAKVGERRQAPGDDLISKVSTSSIDGKPISVEDAIAVCTLVLIGGLDTVASTLGFVAHFLARHPEHRRQLIEKPQLIQGAVDEFLRRFAVTNPGRIVARDHEYKGVRMKEGDMVMLPSFLHGLDDRHYDNPAEVRFDRPVKPNSAFGNGDHRCPGSNLARVELKVFLQEWLPRIPDFRIAEGQKPGVRAGINGSFYYLPLTWARP
ncbi:MAG TPA: cytochrome P450, partial [Nevskia sp.]|nr:cytochrome P450 [Nevskia sp.]